MKHLWINHTEARDFAAGVTQPAVRAVLRGLHNLLLESAGFFPECFLRPRIVPAASLDVLAFYQLVAQVFSDPTAATTVEVGAVPDSIRLVDVGPAIQFVESFQPPRCRKVLLRFLFLVSTVSLPAGEQIDVLYCCRLLAVLIPNEEALDNILSGAAERQAAELLQDPDWFG